VFMQLTPGIIVGALLGAFFADALRSDDLRRFFGVFELLVAIQMTFNVKPRPHRQLPQHVGMFSAGGVIGAISAIVGIGGGTMTVPFLVWCNVSMRNAVATSSACGLPIAVAGAIGFIFTGWNEVALPTYSSGYVYWPAFAGIVAASILTAPLGARLAHRLPAAQLKHIFAVLLYILGIRMLLGV
jgi:hypothetical protein